jgi:subtilisin family serine protease
LAGLFDEKTLMTLTRKPAFLLLLFAAATVAPIFAQAPSVPAPPRISGEILAHRIEKQPAPGLSAALHEANLQRMGLAVGGTDAEQCALYVERPLSPQERAELFGKGVDVHETYIPPVPGKHPHGFHLATVRYDRLDAVSNDARLVRLESAELRSEPHNDQAVSWTQAKLVHEGTTLPQGYDGTGVKIAVADSGLDLTHGDIPTPVEAYDMTDGTGVGTWATDVANTVSPHGTHVTASVLGRGTLSGGKYVGAAPGASLYFYKIGDDTTAGASETDEIEALNRALAVGCDIFTMSYGGTSTYMDGSSAMCQAVDAAVAAGMTVFISAGNEQEDDQHASMDVAPGATSPAFGYTTTPGLLPTGTALNIRVIWRDGAPSDGNMTMTCTNLGAGESLTQAFSSWSSRGTDAKRYTLVTNQAAGASKTYNLQLQNTAVSGATPKVHLYEVSGGGTFDSPDSGYTVGNPALADSAIAVAAWTHRESWLNYKGTAYSYPSYSVGTLAPFSSLGPRIDGTMKPTIAAPGAATISARDSVGGLAASDPLIVDNDGLNLNGSGPANYYVMSGTSMACPHAAGVAALLLEAQPTMTPAQVLEALTSTAAQAGSPDNLAGYGLMNALSAIREDYTAPELTDILTQNAGPTNADSIEYAVTFTESVADLTVDAFTVTTVSGDATGTVNPSISPFGNPYMVTVENITGDGTLRLDLTDTTGVVDMADNALADGGTGDLSTIDNTAPAASIGSPSTNLTAAGPVDWTVTYTGADSVSLTTAAVTLDATGTATGQLTVLDGTTTTPTVRVSSIAGDGTLGISIAGGAAADNAGNSDPGAGPSATATVDNTAPTIMIGPPSVGLTNSGPVEWTVTYSGSDSINLTTAAVTLDVTGTATGQLTVLDGTTTPPTVRVSSIAGDGTLGISIAGGAAADNAGNSDPGAGPSATATIDNTPPTVSIGAPTPATTGAGPVDWPVTYTGADSVNLTAGDIAIETVGDVTGSLSVIDGASTTPTVRISGIGGNGSFSIAIAAGTATDLAGHADAGAGPGAAVTIVNPTAPVYVDFGWVGTESGSETEPFNTLAEGLATTPYAGTVHIFSGSAAGPFLIDQRVRLEAHGGLVRLGESSGGSPQALDRIGEGPFGDGRSGATNWLMYY